MTLPLFLLTIIVLILIIGQYASVFVYACASGTQEQELPLVRLPNGTVVEMGEPPPHPPEDPNFCRDNPSNAICVPPPPTQLPGGIIILEEPVQVSPPPKDQSDCGPGEEYMPPPPCGSAYCAPRDGSEGGEEEE